MIFRKQKSVHGPDAGRARLSHKNESTDKYSSGSPKSGLIDHLGDVCYSAQLRESNRERRRVGKGKTCCSSPGSATSKTCPNWNCHTDVHLNI
jgi:hypothetical protein